MTDNATIQALLDDILNDGSDLSQYDSVQPEPEPEVTESVTPEPEPEPEPAPAPVVEAPVARTPLSPTEPKGGLSLDDILNDAEDATPPTPAPAEDETPVATQEPEVAVRAEETQQVDEQAEVTDPVTEAADLPPVDESMWSQQVTPDRIPLPTFTSEEMMEEMDIRKFGMLVSLSTQRWHAKKRDRDAATNAATATGAKRDAFEARKRLLVGADEKLKRVHAAIDAARTYHYQTTLPWSTIGVNDHGKRSGPRLLPNKLVFEYSENMAKFENEMNEALDDFVQAYPTLIAIAQQNLGKSFKADDYPPVSMIRRYFHVDYDFQPIPKGDDIMESGLDEARVRKLATTMQQRTQQMLENAMQELWHKLHQDLTHLYERLSTPEAKFHYTLIDKMVDYSKQLELMNVTDDARISKIHGDIKQNIAKHDVKSIRDDDRLRHEVAEHAAAILGQMKEFVNDDAS